MKRALFVIIALSIAIPQAQAEILLVPADYATIQQAIDSSNNGDVVIVEPGTYPENINFSGKNIVLTSTDPEDPEIVDATIIDGRGRGSVVVFENRETSEAVLTGFTITGGSGTLNLLFGEGLLWGAGIYCNNASPTIKRNVITENHGALGTEDTPNSCYGGAIACVECEAIITQNIIRNNTAFAGAGIMTYPFSDPSNETVSIGHTIITNNMIYNNSALIGGGVVLLYGGHLINNTIVGNDISLAGSDIGEQGGNIYVASHPVLGQCLVVNNIICNAKSGGGIYSDSPEVDLIAFNDVWNNLPVNYYARDPVTYEMISDGAADRTGLDGNISRDPLFFRGSYNISADSPCHDAGDPNYAPYLWQRDIDGEFAVMGARVDIGADEVTDNARPIADAGKDQFFDTLIANITLDGTGSFDFNADDVISYQWQQTSGPNVTISNPDTPEPNFAPPAEAIYIFELTVFDGNFHSNPDSVTIVVGNRAPIADAGDEQASEPRREITLDGSASYDLDEEDTLSYSWSQVSGPSVALLDPNTQTPRFTPYLIGEYVFELTVNDGADTSAPDTVTVFCRIGSEPDAYGYHWIDSDSAWGTKYNWIDIQQTGTIITGLENSFEEYAGPFPLGFDFNFYGNTYNQFYVQSNGAISFNAGAITYQNEQIPTADESNNIIAWMWTYMYPSDISKIYYQQFHSYTIIQFVDYQIAWGGTVNAEVKIYKSGKIVLQYKDFSDDAYRSQYTIGIEDYSGTIGTQVAINNRNYLHDELAIEFSIGPPIRPVADAGSDQHVAKPELITLDGSGSFVYDPCSVLEYEWDQLVGPAVELTDPTGMHPTFMPEIEGEYRFELVVIGDEDFSEPDEVLILVGNQPPIIAVGPNIITPVSGRITLDGSGSYDPDPIDELSYKWTQLEGPEVFLRNAETATPYFTCNQEGIYVFELVVSDGFVDSEPRLIKVETVSVTNNQNILEPGFITDDYFHYPDVSGSKVVYCVGQFDNYRWAIRSKDLETGEVDDTFLGGGINTQPKIDGDVVVWAAGPFSAGSRGPECIGIMAKNIATGTEVTLRQYSNSQSYSHPAVSGNIVVWLEHRDINKNIESQWTNTPYSICGADITDLSKPVYFTIAEHVGRRDPYPYEDYSEDFDDVIDISGNIVVYEADGDIYGADISNLNAIKVFTICSDPARQYDPAISGDIVVWTDERNDRGDIYGADISETENIRELAIVKSRNNQSQPDIDGCLIVYIEGGSYSGQINVCCLTKKYSVMNVALTDYHYGMGPAINADTIVWQNSNYGEIEGITLEFAYSGIDGAVQNLTTGKYYDYIQHAIVAGRDGEQIVAGEGIYNESINFKGKKLTVRSANPDDPSVVAATVINGSSLAVTFSGGEDAASILRGFTITGANNGIYCTEAAPVIADCIITGNTNAGIKLYSSGNPTITNCSIVDNRGAGIEMHPKQAARFAFYNYPVISNSIIAKNFRQGIFGGVPTITNCTIVENLQGGIYGSRPTVINSIIYFNGNAIAESTATVTYSDVQGSWPGLGNIDADPLFASLYWISSDSTETGDYHLKSLAGRWDPDSQTWIQDNLSSPCIDRGDPASPVGNEPSPNGSIINMGAYGGTAQASMTSAD